ncbi:MAG: rRNA maturation RNase YbeY [Fimbriimonadaceae bacterium]|nr:rRNA maturation RNase YbeY [Fimbriimonadaceae bacterium]
MLLLVDHHQAHSLDATALRRIGETACDLLFGTAVEVSVALLTDAQIAELHRDYLNLDEPTDVLTFPQLLLTPAGAPPPPGALLGDIAISVDTAAAQAAAFVGWTVADEVALLLVHGLLHLRGYDDQDPSSAAAMRLREDELLQAAGRPAAPREAD